MSKVVIDWPVTFRPMARSIVKLGGQKSCKNSSLANYMREMMLGNGVDWANADLKISLSTGSEYAAEDDFLARYSLGTLD